MLASRVKPLLARMQTVVEGDTVRAYPHGVVSGGVDVGNWKVWSTRGHRVRLTTAQQFKRQLPAHSSTHLDCCWFHTPRMMVAIRPCSDPFRYGCSGPRARSTAVLSPPFHITQRHFRTDPATRGFEIGSCQQRTHPDIPLTPRGGRLGLMRGRHRGVCELGLKGTWSSGFGRFIS